MMNVVKDNKWTNERDVLRDVLALVYSKRLSQSIRIGTQPVAEAANRVSNLG